MRARACGCLALSIPNTDPHLLSHPPPTPNCCVRARASRTTQSRRNSMKLYMHRCNHGNVFIKSFWFYLAQHFYYPSLCVIKYIHINVKRGLEEDECMYICGEGSTGEDLSCLFSLTDIVQTSTSPQSPTESLFFPFVKCKVTLKEWRSKRNMIYVRMEASWKYDTSTFDFWHHPFYCICNFQCFFVWNLQIWGCLVENECEIFYISIFSMVTLFK